MGKIGKVTWFCKDSRTKPSFFGGAERSCSTFLGNSGAPFRFVERTNLDASFERALRPLKHFFESKREYPKFANWTTFGDVASTKNISDCHFYSCHTSHIEAILVPTKSRCLYHAESRYGFRVLCWDNFFTPARFQIFQAAPSEAAGKMATYVPERNEWMNISIWVSEWNHISPISQFLTC